MASKTSGQPSYLHFYIHATRVAPNFYDSERADLYRLTFQPLDKHHSIIRFVVKFVLSRFFFLFRSVRRFGRIANDRKKAEEWKGFFLICSAAITTRIIILKKVNMPLDRGWFAGTLTILVCHDHCNTPLFCANARGWIYILAEDVLHARTPRWGGIEYEKQIQLC